MFAEVDEDCSGEIDFEEFLILVAKQVRCYGISVRREEGECKFMARKLHARVSLSYTHIQPATTVLSRRKQIASDVPHHSLLGIALSFRRLRPRARRTLTTRL